jgi:hypothetical protein
MSPELEAVTDRFVNNLRDLLRSEIRNEIDKRLGSSVPPGSESVLRSSPWPDAIAREFPKNIDQSLGSSVPPGSESALRGKTQEDIDLERYKKQLAKGQVDLSIDVTEQLEEAAERSHRPTRGLVAQLDSNKKDQDILASSVPPNSDSALRGGDSYRLDWLEHVGSGSFARTLTGWQCAGGRGPTLRAAIDDSIDDVMPPRQPAGGPPTADLAAQPDSNNKDPDSLGSAVPPSSESALRGKWRVGSKVKLNVYEADRPVCQCHSFIDAHAIVAAMNRFAAQAPAYDFDDRQPAGGPPTPDLADSPNSNTEDWYKTNVGQRIGVYDYDSLVACLSENFCALFPETNRLRTPDPQDMIQLMTATIQNLRRRDEK